MSCPAEIHALAKHSSALHRNVLSSSLERALFASSPRFTPPATPLGSILIHVAVAALWIATLVFAFVLGGVFAWSTGIAYILYDTVLLAFVFVQTFSLHAPLASQGDAPVRTTLGVVIAAHNEAIVLPATLGALLDQSDPAEEIVVADDGSSDATSELLTARYGLIAPSLGSISAPSEFFPTLRWLRLRHQGKGHALNAAILETTTQIVVTLDADTHLESEAVRAMRQAFAREPGLVAATGILFPVCSTSVQGSMFEWFQTYEYMRNFLSRYAWMQLNSLLLISGAFAGFRREALLQVGGFDADCLVEDYELIHRLRRFGMLHGQSWTTTVVGAARARTEAPGTVMNFLRQRRRWFGGFLQTQYWYRDMVGNRRYGWLGTVMLPVKAFDTFQPIYGLTALLVFLYYCVSRQGGVIFPVSALIVCKIGVDLGFHLWSVHLYRAWTGARTNARFGAALFAALLEPFSFQILRHVGAAWGWFAFASKRPAWGGQERVGISQQQDRL